MTDRPRLFPVRLPALETTLRSPRLGEMLRARLPAIFFIDVAGLFQAIAVTTAAAPHFRPIEPRRTFRHLRPFSFGTDSFVFQSETGAGQSFARTVFGFRSSDFDFTAPFSHGLFAKPKVRRPKPFFKHHQKPCNFFRNSSRPRAMRDLTVPTFVSSVAAISS